jgi:hypothetical protein
MTNFKIKSWRSASGRVYAKLYKRHWLVFWRLVDIHNTVEDALRNARSLVDIDAPKAFD